MKTFSRYKILIGGSVVLLVMALLAGRLLIERGRPAGDIPQTITVERKALTAEIVDRGVIRPERIAAIGSVISSNQAKIVWMMEEGSRVEKGTMVARFDTKPFIDSLLKAEQLHADANASYLAAKKVLSLQEEEEAGKIEAAERKVEIAEIKANNIKNGSGPLKRKVLVQKLNQAKRSLEISRNELDDMKTLLEKGHVSNREKEKAQDTVITAEEQMAVARAEINNFDNYLWPQMLREGELLTGAAHSDHERVKRTAELLIQNRVAEVEKNRRLKDARLVALESARQDIENCRVYCPTEGILLYSELPRNNGTRKLHIGDSVWVGQTFLEVPDTSELIAEIQVREVDVAKIRVGMTATIAVDAFPEKIFQGEVSSIASLAKEDQQNSGIRRFHTRVSLTGDTSGVQVGMSVTTRIIYSSIEDALVVPLSAVVYRGGRPVVQKIAGDRTVAVEVELGVQGQQIVEILSGLAVGDVIVKQAL
jgi:HlyD family secretion protein